MVMSRFTDMPRPQQCQLGLVSADVPCYDGYVCIGWADCSAHITPSGELMKVSLPVGKTTLRLLLQINHRYLMALYFFEG